MKDITMTERQKEFVKRLNLLFETLNYENKQKILDNLPDSLKEIFEHLNGLSAERRIQGIESLSPNQIWQLWQAIPIDILLHYFVGKTSATQKKSLSQFIEDNHKNLSVLSVFIALTVFSNNLPNKSLGHYISFVSLGAVVLLWFEVWVKIELSSSEVRLRYFKQVLLMAFIGLISYWFLEFRDLWHYYLPGIIFAFFITLGDRLLLTRRIQFGLGKLKFISLRNQAVITKSDMFAGILDCVVLAAYVGLSYLLSSIINYGLDKLTH